MKKFLLILTLSLFSFCLFAQESVEAVNEGESPAENIETEETVDYKGKEFTQSESFIEFIHSLDFVFHMETGMYLNTESKLISAPSPVIYPLTIGILWPNYTFIALQPTVSFFMMNHLWYEDRALPAEIENRTSTTLSFMITLPVVISIYTKNSRLQLMPGISMLARFGLLANNVASDDYGYTGTAGGDMDEINNWFWKNGNFIYLSAGASWIFKFHNEAKAGPVMNLYIPIGSAINYEGMQGFMFSTGFKISL